MLLTPAALCATPASAGGNPDCIADACDGEGSATARFLPVDLPTLADGHGAAATSPPVSPSVVTFWRRGVDDVWQLAKAPARWEAPRDGALLACERHWH